MTDDETPAPDSLRGKMRDLLGGGDEEDEDAAEAELPRDAEERPAPEPKRPTDPPF